MEQWMKIMKMRWKQEMHWVSFWKAIYCIFFHHYATKKFEQMAVLKRQMVDDLVSILLGFPKGRCHDDVATMSKATRMVSLQSLCTLRDGNGNGYDVLPFRCAKSFHAWGEKGIFHVRLVRCWGCLKVIVPKAYCFECLC
jgi:hypothetical protein